MQTSINDVHLGFFREHVCSHESQMQNARTIEFEPYSLTCEVVR